MARELVEAAVTADAPRDGAEVGGLPRVERNGEAIQLMVEGEPYLAFGGELHNSSPSSPEYRGMFGAGRGRRRWRVDAWAHAQR